MILMIFGLFFLFLIYKEQIVKHHRSISRPNVDIKIVLFEDICQRIFGMLQELRMV